MKTEELKELEGVIMRARDRQRHCTAMNGVMDCQRATGMMCPECSNYFELNTAMGTVQRISAWLSDLEELVNSEPF